MSFDRYYREELSYLRELGAEFAGRNASLAPFLARESFDPDVERLLEGFRIPDRTAAAEARRRAARAHAVAGADRRAPSVDPHPGHDRGSVSSLQDGRTRPDDGQARLGACLASDSRRTVPVPHLLRRQADTGAGGGRERGDAGAARPYSTGARPDRPRGVLRARARPAAPLSRSGRQRSARQVSVHGAAHAMPRSEGGGRLGPRVRPAAGRGPGGGFPARRGGGPVAGQGSAGLAAASGVLRVPGQVHVPRHPRSRGNDTVSRRAARGDVRSRRTLCRCIGPRRRRRAGERHPGRQPVRRRRRPHPGRRPQGRVPPDGAGQCRQPVRHSLGAARTRPGIRAPSARAGAWSTRRWRPSTCSGR